MPMSDAARLPWSWVRHLVPVFVWLLIAVLGFSGALEAGTAYGPVGSAQRTADAYLARSETKAVAAFAVARTINAAVSFLKSADLSAVVAQVAPMQVLEPVDDLAKQFSDVMVVSIVAIQLQRLLLRISQAWALGVVLPAGCAALALSCIAMQPVGLRLRLAALGRSLVVLALFARFLVPAACLVGHSVTDRFLAGDLDATMHGMQASGGGLDRITGNAVSAAAPPSPPSPPDPGQQGAAPPSLLGRLGAEARQAVGRGESLMSSAQGLVPDRGAINAFVVELPGQIVAAIAIFLVQTVLTPFCVAIFLFVVLRTLFRPVLPGAFPVASGSSKQSFYGV